MSTLQSIMPQHLLSRIMGKLTYCHIDFLKNWAINTFVKIYNVDLSEAAIDDVTKYISFNSFFIRHLRAGARPIANGQGVIASPADGTISQIGKIEKDILIQAKGHEFTLDALLGGNQDIAKKFINGTYTTIYLSPRDYHRVHMPYDGILQKMIYIPGKLFSVNQKTTNQVSNLFARNERVVCLFATPMGPMAVIFVGAFFVASISTTWQGIVTPNYPRKITTYDYPNQNISYKKGDELGYFNFGSTVILLLPEKSSQWLPELNAGQSIQMGQALTLGKFV